MAWGMPVHAVYGLRIYDAAQQFRLAFTHAAILQAINCGDADQAERLVREHCARASDHIATQLTRHVRTLEKFLRG